jgi:hypothetical protein
MNERPTRTGLSPHGQAGAARLVSLVNRPVSPPRPVDELLARWHEASGSSLPFDEWCDPMARHLARVLRDEDRSRVIDAAVVTFAQARAGAEHGAEDVAADLTALLGLVGAPPAEPTLDRMALVTRALAAWANERVAETTAASCIDPVTGLVNGGYLRPRLQEIHAQCEGLAIAASSAFGALVVRLGLAGASTQDRMAAPMAVGRAMRLAFQVGETVAVIRPARLVAVMPAYALDRGHRDLAALLADRPQLADVPVSIHRQAFGDNADATWWALAGIPVGA